MIITKEIIKQGETKKGQLNGKQTIALLVSKEDKKKKGWKKRLIGKDIPKENIELFLSLKNYHFKNKKKKVYSKEDKIDKISSYINKRKTNTKTKKVSYDKYLRSKDWKRRKAQHFKFSGKFCVICKTTSKIHAHHSAYKNVRTDKEIFDLVSLCECCHSRLHKTHDKKEDLQIHTFKFIEDNKITQ